MRYSTLVAAVLGEEVKGGYSATAGEVVGSPKDSASFNTTVDAVHQMNSRGAIGYAMGSLPDASDLLQVMLTIRS